MSEDGLYLFNSTSKCNLCCIISVNFDSTFGNVQWQVVDEKYK